MFYKIAWEYSIFSEEKLRRRKKQNNLPFLHANTAGRESQQIRLCPLGAATRRPYPLCAQCEQREADRAASACHAPLSEGSDMQLASVGRQNQQICLYLQEAATRRVSPAGSQQEEDHKVR